MDIADQIKSPMFVFEDPLLWTRRASSACCATSTRRTLALALRAASDEPRNIRSNMSERAGQALEEDRDARPVRVKDVEAAHARIIEVVRGLSDSARS